MMEPSNALINIAIDGYSSCGKSTLAKGMAARLHYAYVDTGAMYRAITLFAIRNRVIFDGQVNEKGLLEALDRVHIDFVPDTDTGRSLVMLNGETVEDAIRGMEVSNSVSSVASIPEVRQKLVHIQKRIAEKKGVVMDGRDIGTVVLPNAELKFFVTADEKVRAERRFRELTENGDAVTLEEVLENIRERDHEDTHREESPLQRAPDAILIDTTDRTPQEQLDVALEYFEGVVGG